MNKGEIWLVEFPSVSVHEQIGTRPVIILADTKVNVCIVIPLTSNLNYQRFSYTTRIESSNSNKLDSDSIALIFQMRSIDKRRIIKKVGDLEKGYILEINKRLRNFLNL